LARWLAGSGGAAAVELALVLPVLMVLAFGFLEVGRLFWTYHIASSSVRDAARYAARLGLTCPGNTNSFGSLAPVRRLARTGSLIPGAPDLIPGWTSNGTVQVQVSCVANAGNALGGAYNGVQNIPVVTVIGTTPYTPLFGDFIGGMATTTITVSNQQAWTQ